MNHEASPPIAVVIPARNAARWIGEAIRSVRDQTLPPAEILVGDDGSEDGTASIVEAIGDPRIRLIRSDAPIGISAMLNRLVGSSQARYLARMDADDTSHPDRFRRQLEFLESGDLAFCGTWARRFEGASTLHPMPEHHDDILAESGFAAPFVHPTVLFDRRRLAAAGAELLYDPSEDLAEDYGLWRRLLPRARAGNVPTELLRWRLHDRNAGTAPATRDVQSAVATRIRQRTWAGSGLDLDPLQERAIALLLSTGIRSPADLASLAAAFGKVLRHDPALLWAPLPALRRNLSSRWNHACLVASWGTPEVLITWARHGIRAGLHLRPSTAGKIVLKSMVRDRRKREATR